MVESDLPKTCFNCIHWTLDDNQEEVRESVGRPAERAHAYLYGKCEATYIDEEGEKVKHNRGTFGVSFCSASDDHGNILFESKAEPSE